MTEYPLCLKCLWFHPKGGKHWTYYAYFLVLLFMVSGCATVIIDIGGTVNYVPVAKASNGYMTSTVTATEDNKNDGEVTIPLTK